ncbi:hypothetical protein QEN19_001283 [Hanseniaspora menglaensis]
MIIKELDFQKELSNKFKLLMTFYGFMKFKHKYLNSVKFSDLKNNVDKSLKAQKSSMNLSTLDLSMIAFIFNLETAESATKKFIDFKYISKEQYELENQSVLTKGKITNQASNDDIFELKEMDDEENENMYNEFLVIRVKIPASSNKTIQTLKDYIKKSIEVFNKKLTTFVETEFNSISMLQTLAVPKPTVHEDPLNNILNKENGVKRKQIDNAEIDYYSNINENLKITEFLENYLKPEIEMKILAKDPEYKNNLNLPKLIKQIIYPIGNLYTHQHDSIAELMNNKNVILTTSTSSGKSLVYQITSIWKILEDIESTILYIAPTKALAQDQVRSMNEILEKIKKLSDQELYELIPATFKSKEEAIFKLKKLAVSTYDGDTTQEQRKLISNWSENHIQIIFTNPDMIHAAMLPNHQKWAGFLQKLKLIVIDELHIYNSLFGTHVSLVFRRLKRLLDFYNKGDTVVAGNNLYQTVWLGCSATLRNPTDAFRQLTGNNIETTKLVSNDGSPNGIKHIVLENPDLENLNKRDNIGATARILVELMKRDIKTIAFCHVRRLCEILIKEVKKLIQQDSNFEQWDYLLNEVVSYRGGYSAADRRKIERELFHGGVKCCISTNALELGIDIGSLDCVVMCGFPLTLGNFQQQSGRSGRNVQESMTVLVCGDSPVDQYYFKNKEELISEDSNMFQDLVVDLENLLVLGDHLQCAAFELPLSLTNDYKYFENDVSYELWESTIKEKLLFNGSDHKVDVFLNNTYTCSEKYLPWPSGYVSLRGVQEEMFAVVDVTNNRNIVIEEIETSRTSFTLYDGAIFIHQGISFLVKEFNSQEHYAKVIRTDVEYTTSQRDYTDVDPLEIEIVKPINDTDMPIFFGKLETTIKVFGFFKIDKWGKIIDAIETYNPPFKFKSKGFWIDLPEKCLEYLERKSLNKAASIHAAQHCLISCLPKYIITGFNEIKTECKAPEKEFSQRTTERVRPARILIYDSRGGPTGSGLSSKAFDNINDILKTCLSKVETCECSNGCPSCGISLPNCSEMNMVLSKNGCRIILEVLLGASEERMAKVLASCPEELPEDNGSGIETIKVINGTVKYSPHLKVLES